MLWAAVSGTTWHFALPTFVAGYLANPPAGNPDGASTTRSFNWLQVGLSGALTTIPHYAGVPKAYLRLLVYRADSTVLLDQVAAVDTRAQGNAGWQDLLLPQQVLPTGATYAQVYVANEDNVPVWFDEVMIVHWPGLQVQENHYDPFGLDLAGLSRSTPGLKALSQYQWNGKEKQSDFGLGWTHLDWRFFDPQTGRFHAVDPLTQAGQESWSTYQFGFDNAVRYNDPDGRFPGLAEAQAAWASTKRKLHEVGKAAERKVASALGVNGPELAYARNHPVNAWKIGYPNKLDPAKGNGYTGTADRFANNAKLDNTQINTMRHGLGQAITAQQLGQQVAKEAGDAHDIPGTKDVDSQVDQFNNQVGRAIGLNPSNTDKNPQQMALVVLDGIRKGDFRVVVNEKITQSSLTQTQYNAARDNILSLTTGGYTADNMTSIIQQSMPQQSSLLLPR